MTPFDYMKAMAELWGRGGQDFAAAQQRFFSDFAKTTGSEGTLGVPPVGTFDAQGGFNLAAKSCDDSHWITIRSSAFSVRGEVAHPRARLSPNQSWAIS